MIKGRNAHRQVEYESRLDHPKAQATEDTETAERRGRGEWGKGKGVLENE
jgi:hypothetical protein